MRSDRIFYILFLQLFSVFHSNNHNLNLTKKPPSQKVAFAVKSIKFCF